MIIKVRKADYIVGSINGKYDVRRLTETTLIPESDEDRDAIIEFVSDHVPSVDLPDEEEYDEEYAPGMPEPPED